MWITEENETRKVVFSGDVGNLNQPIIKDPAYVQEADYVVIESTYGDRSPGKRSGLIPCRTSAIASSSKQDCTFF